MDAVQPVAVALHVFAVLLDKELLHFLEVLLARAFVGHVLQLGDGDAHQLFVHLLVGVEADEEHEGLFRAEAEVALHAHAVSAAFVFTDLLGVDDVHHVVEGLHGQLVLAGVFHVAAVDGVAGHLGVFHGLGVVVVEVLFSDGRHIGGPSFVVFLALQCTNVLLNQWFEGLGVDVAHEGENEVVGVLEAVGIEFQGLGVVHLVVVFGLHALDERMVVVHGEHQVVAEGGQGIRFGVGDHGLGTGDVGLESLFVGARRGEIQIGELQHGLKVASRAVAPHAFGHHADAGINAGFLSSQDFGQVDGAEVAHAAKGGQRVDFLQGVGVALVHHAVAAEAVGRHQDFVVLEGGGLVDDFHAVFQGEHCGVEGVVVFLALDAAFHGQDGNQGLVADGLHVGFHLHLVGFLEQG